MKHTDRCQTRAEIEAILLAAECGADQERLATHLDSCASCRAIAESIEAQSRLEADLHWAETVRAQTPVDLQEPFRRLSRILPEYEILGELGRGGMGVVYRARQPKLDRMVAIKVLPTLVSIARPDARERFRREAKLAAGLEHTGIISVYDFGEVDGTLYFTMQLIEGRPLSRILEEVRETGSLDGVLGGSAASAEERPSRGGTLRHQNAAGTYDRLIASWVADVADALQYAHERGVIHRDIKPSNLLVRTDGRIMISDFGLARCDYEETLTMAPSLLGTCRYLSPEQVDPLRGPVDALADVYALGATLYEMLTLRPVFTAADDRQILHHVLHEDPLPPHRHKSSVPRELETICLKALEKDRARRYQSARELADDLRRWLLDLPIQARRQSVVQRVRRTLRRKRLPVATGALVVALAGLCAALWIARENAHRRNDETEARARVSEATLAAHEALALFESERFEPALTAVSHAMSLAPDRADLVHLKARILLRHGRRHAAIEILESHLKTRQDDATAHFLAGYALHYDFGHPPEHPWSERDHLAHQPGGHGELRERWERLLEHHAAVERLAPGSAAALCLGSCVEPDPAVAIDQLGRAVERDATLVEALEERACRYGDLGRWDEALTNLTLASEAGQVGSRIHGLTGIAHYHLEDYGAAEAAFTRAIELDTENIDWWYDRAVARTYLGRYALAVEDATRAIELDPQYAFAYVARARGRVGLGDANGAMHDYGLAESIDPDLRDIYAERSQLAQRLGDLDRAFADADRLIAVAPRDAHSHLRRAELHIRAAHWEDAFRDLDAALELAPEDAVVWQLRGSAFLQSERLEDAADAYGIASRLQPGAYTNYMFRAQALVRLGRHQEAVTTLTRWIVSAAPTEMGYLRRGAVYEEMAEHSLALADYRAAADLNPAVAGYARIWCAIILRERGELAESTSLLVALTADTDPWIASVASHLLGHSTTPTFLSSALDDRQLAEAHYYMGIRQVWDGDMRSARESFATCAASPHRDLFEVDFSRLRSRQFLSPPLIEDVVEQP